MEDELPKLCDFVEEVDVVDDTDVDHISNQTDKSRNCPRFRIEDSWK